MKIVVLGAFGRSGSAVVAEAEKRGHEVLAVGHHKHDDLNFAHELIKDTRELTKDDLAGADVVVDAISAWTPDTFPVHTATVSHVANLLAGTKTRYVKVGGTGTMYINPDHTQEFKDWENYPAKLKPLASALSATLQRLRSYSNIAWTFVCPALNFKIENPVTGQYQVAGEDFALPDLLKTEMSYADFAHAIVDMLESGGYVRQRVMVYRLPAEG